MSPWAGIDEFVAVAQVGSFSGAAKRLGRSTSQVSRDIAQLEGRLDLRLFYRTTRKVSLTDAGQDFLDRCRKLIEDRDEAIASVNAKEDGLQGHLRMTCALAYGERFIASSVNDFLIAHPRLSVDLVLTDQVLDLISEGFDLAIRTGQLKNSGLVATRLASRRRFLCASPAYLAVAGVPITLGDLDNHVCIRGTSDTWLFNRDGRPYLFRPGGRLRCNSGEAALTAALQGLGLCRLPDFYVEEHIGNGELVSLLDEHRPKDEPVWAVYPHRHHLPPKVRLMLEHLHAFFRARLRRTEALHGRS
jgi:DNA-binding transcriptional LysR family regulator